MNLPLLGLNRARRCRHSVSAGSAGLAWEPRDEAPAATGLRAGGTGIGSGGSAVLGCTESLLDGPGGNLGPRAEAEPAENAADVVFDGAFAEHQRLGHCAVRAALGDQASDLLLAGG